MGLGGKNTGKYSISENGQSGVVSPRDQQGNCVMGPAHFCLSLPAK